MFRFRASRFYSPTIDMAPVEKHSIHELADKVPLNNHTLVIVGGVILAVLAVVLFVLFMSWCCGCEGCGCSPCCGPSYYFLPRDEEVGFQFYVFLGKLTFDCDNL